MEIEKLSDIEIKELILKLHTELRSRINARLQAGDNVNIDEQLYLITPPILNEKKVEANHDNKKVNKPANQGKKWEENEHKNLHRLLAEKKSWEQIATELGRSELSIKMATATYIRMQKKVGLNDQEIAAKVNVSAEEVHKLLNEKGYKF